MFRRRETPPTKVGSLSPALKRIHSSRSLNNAITNKIEANELKTYMSTQAKKNLKEGILNMVEEEFDRFAVSIDNSTGDDKLTTSSGGTTRGIPFEKIPFFLNALGCPSTSEVVYIVSNLTCRKVR